MIESSSNSITNHFHTLLEQRTTFFDDNTINFDAIWVRSLREKWSIGETLYHLILMFRVFRRFSKVYIPAMMPIATIRKNKRFETIINDIYKEYHVKKKKGMSAPILIKPPKKIKGAYSLMALQQLLQKETEKLNIMTAKIDECLAGNIYYFDPLAHHPNLIQSIHLLAIHEQHHFELVKKYQQQGN